jgi:hypothetical protein
MRKTPIPSISTSKTSPGCIYGRLACRPDAGFVDVGCELKNPNFARMYEGVGVKGIRVEDPHDLKRRSSKRSIIPARRS